MPRGRKPNPNKVVRTNTLPSSDADLAKLRGFVREAVDNRIMQRAQRDKYGEIVQSTMDSFPITKKLFAKLVNFEYRQNFPIVSQENAEIQEAYEKLVAAADKQGSNNGSNSGGSSGGSNGFTSGPAPLAARADDNAHFEVPSELIGGGNNNYEGNRLNA
jgi:hypothetical protein